MNIVYTMDYLQTAEEEYDNNRTNGILTFRWKDLQKNHSYEW